jgi:hypothetical protein
MSATSDEYFAKKLKSCATFLERWKGANAVMWDLTVSIKTLRIVLTRAEQKGNLLLACLDPLRISGPVRWEHATLVVLRVRLPENSDDGFLLRDEKAGVEVLCGGLEVKENVKLYDPT